MPTEIMDVQYPAELHESDEQLRLLQKASSLLCDILGPQSSQLVKAKWQRVQDQKGRLLDRLTIRDFTVEVSTDFALAELRNQLHMSPAGPTTGRPPSGPL